MRIINVLEIINGIPQNIESFLIYEEQLSRDVVEKAENLFIQKINENIYPDVLSDEEQEYYIEQGSFYRHTSCNVFLIWSNINE